jgi:hypothetical protein
MSDKKHRVIGIRHTLRKLKDEGLVDDSTNYPDVAVGDIKDEAILTAKKAYWIGARRGANEVIEAFLNGDLVIGKDNNGNPEITANIDTLKWEKSVRVTFGVNKIIIPKAKYRLDIKKNLDFK